jgi:hypothetical protein
MLSLVLTVAVVNFVCFAFGRYLESRVAKQRERALRFNYEALIELHIEERDAYKAIADRTILELQAFKDGES